MIILLKLLQQVLLCLTLPVGCAWASRGLDRSACPLGVSFLAASSRLEGEKGMWFCTVPVLPSREKTLLLSHIQDL